MFEPQESAARTQALNAAQDMLAADLPVLVLYYPGLANGLPSSGL